MDRVSGPGRAVRIARPDEQGYREYPSEEPRGEAGCPAGHRDRLWRCSLDNAGVTNQNYLRGVQGAQVSLATDNVFGDGASLELATMTGSVTSGYTAALTVAI